MNETREVVVESLDDLQKFADDFAAHLSGGEIIGLSGPLGAGKTEFVRALAHALHAADEVSSPTFVLEAIYRLPQDRLLHHWDFYRLRNDLPEAELADYVGDPRRIVVIEWPERVEWSLALLTFHLRFEFRENPEARRIRVASA